MFSSVSRAFRKLRRWGARAADHHTLSRYVETASYKTDGCQAWSLEGEGFVAFVDKVVDGDTIDILFTHKKTGDSVTKMRCRFFGVDAPETALRKGVTPAEKAKGLEVKRWLTDEIDKKYVFIQCKHFDKYGRLLVVPHRYCGSRIRNDICEEMLHKKMVVKYEC